MNTAPLTKQEYLDLLLLLSSLESLYLAAHANARSISVPDHMWDQLTETAERLSAIVLHSGIDG